MLLIKVKRQFNPKYILKSFSDRFSIIRITHFHHSTQTGRYKAQITMTITYKSIVEADIAFQLRPSMLELHNRNFCCSDRYYIVNHISVPFQCACKCFNYLDTVQTLWSQHTAFRTTIMLKWRTTKCFLFSVCTYRHNTVNSCANKTTKDVHNDLCRITVIFRQPAPKFLCIKH